MGSMCGLRMAMRRRSVGLLSDSRWCPVTASTADTVSMYLRRSASPSARSCSHGGGVACWRGCVECVECTSPQQAFSRPLPSLHPRHRKHAQLQNGMLKTLDSI